MPADLPRGASPLTAITPIIPGREAAVQAVLDDIKKRISEGGHTPLNDVQTVHFARWVMLWEGNETRLLFTSNFDGPWEVYIDQFIEHAWQVFDAIYSNCDGYPEYGARDSVAFKEFVRKHEVKENVYYKAYPDASVAEVRRALNITRGIRQVWESLQELS